MGFVEYHRKSLFLNPKVVAANQYDNYFRVNSVFFDPSIYGRFLALVMIAVTAVVLSAGGSAAALAENVRARRRELLAGAAVLVWLLAGLVTSFSQSSIAALLLGLAVLGAWCWGVRAHGVGGAGGAGGRGRVRGARADQPAFRPEGLERVRQQRHQRARQRWSPAASNCSRTRPLEGYGSGSFETEYKRHSTAAARAPRTPSRHRTRSP